MFLSSFVVCTSGAQHWERPRVITCDMFGVILWLSLLSVLMSGVLCRALCLEFTSFSLLMIAFLFFLWSCIESVVFQGFHKSSLSYLSHWVLNARFKSLKTNQKEVCVWFRSSALTLRRAWSSCRQFFFCCCCCLTCQSSLMRITAALSAAGSQFLLSQALIKRWWCNWGSGGGQSISHMWHKPLQHP